jgi:hypothetical protein
MVQSMTNQIRQEQGKRERIKTTLIPINISAQYTVYVKAAIHTQ